MKRIWVMQTAFLGDCVLSLPFVKRLCARFPEARVQIITAPAGAEVYRLSLERGLWDETERLSVHVFEKRGLHAGLRGQFDFLRDLKGGEGAPDAVFCLQRSFRTASLAWLSGAEERIGFASGAASFLYTRAVARQWMNGRHEIEKNLDLLRVFDDETHKTEPWVAKGAPSLLRALRPALVPADPAVVISLGSPWPTKRWPVENALPLVRALVDEGHRVQLVGDASAAGLAAQIRAELPSLLVEDHCGRTSIRSWVDLISEARAVVSGDSAAVHVASDLGVPVVALFGPTLPDFGFAPWRRGSLALGVNSLSCRPCDIHGPKECPLGHHRCLKDLGGARVHQVLANVLDREEQSL
jgi:heptosyltransferase-2